MHALMIRSQTLSKVLEDQFYKEICGTTLRLTTLKKNSSLELLVEETMSSKMLKLLFTMDCSVCSSFWDSILHIIRKFQGFKILR